MASQPGSSLSKEKHLMNKHSSSFLKTQGSGLRAQSATPPGERQIVYALFAALLISLAPVVVSFGLLGGAGPYALMVQAAWILQIVVLLVALRSQKLPLGFVALVFLMAVIQGLSLIWGAAQGNPTEIWDVANILVRLASQIVMFGMFYYVVITERMFLLFMKSFVAVAIIACLYNLGVNYDSLHLFGTVAASHGVSFSSFFANRNQFGSFLFLAIVALAYYTAKRRFSILQFLVYALLFVNVVLSLSRAAIGGAVIFLLIILLVNAFRSPLRVAALILGAIAGAVVVVMSSGWLSGMTSYVFRPEAGASGRDIIWEHGLQLWLENPLTGVGMFTGVSMIGPDFGFDQFHSLYVDLLVDTGILGLIFVLALVAVAHGRMFSNRSANRYRSVGFAALVGLVVLTLFESVGFFTASYAATVFTIFFISIPLLLGNMRPNESRGLKISTPAD